MSSRVIAIVCSFITLVCCFALWRGELAFATRAGIENRLKIASRNATEEKIKRLSLQARFKDFQQNVALYIPRDKHNKVEIEARELASVIPHSSFPKSEESLSRMALKSGKELFLDKKYEQSIQPLTDLISKYPESVSSLEASYYLVKAFYETKNKQESMEWAERMIRQFPESVWTARSMILLADIYREQDRRNEALDTYQIVMSSFDEADIREEVKKKMAEMGL